MALLDASDADHARCAALLRDERERRIVPSPVLVELDHFVPTAAFGAFLDDVRRGAFVVEDLRERDYPRIAELLDEYADLRVGFVDAAVLAVVERRREKRLATLDHRHFGVMRPRHARVLQLLPC